LIDVESFDVENAPLRLGVLTFTNHCGDERRWRTWMNRPRRLVHQLSTSATSSVQTRREGDDAAPPPIGRRNVIAGSAATQSARFGDEPNQPAGGRFLPISHASIDDIRRGPLLHRILMPLGVNELALPPKSKARPIDTIDSHLTVFAHLLSKMSELIWRRMPPAK
jgi:hypothetical protein